MKPIKNDEEYEKALAEIEPYFIKEFKEGSEDFKRFVELVKVINEYEDIHYNLDDL